MTFIPAQQAANKAALAKIQGAKNKLTMLMGTLGFKTNDIREDSPTKLRYVYTKDDKHTAENILKAACAYTGETAEVDMKVTPENCGALALINWPSTFANAVLSKLVSTKKDKVKVTLEEWN